MHEKYKFVGNLILISLFVTSQEITLEMKKPVFTLLYSYDKLFECKLS
jgi:hypothetical protein